MQNRVPALRPVPAFTPVPRRHARVDGWTAERQQAFIAALAELGSVKHAAARVNMAPEGAYMLRRAPGAESFAAAWADALDHGVQRLADLALDRAMEGVEVPVYSYGKLVATRRVYNDRLLMFCLRHGIGRKGAGAAAPPAAANDARSPEAKARDLAEGKERWFEEYKEDLLRFVSARGQDLADLAQALRICLQREAEQREAGCYDLEERYRSCADHLARTLEEGPERWQEERGLLAAMIGFEEDLPFHLSAHATRMPAHFEPGPTFHVRDRAREEAKALLARGRAMWKATLCEETWAAWVAGETEGK